MSELKKPVTQWEKEQLMVVNIPDGDKLLDKEVTADEFKSLVDKHNFVGVNHEDRIQFLEDNGYEVNRKNMVDPELSAKQ